MVYNTTQPQKEIFDRTSAVHRKILTKNNLKKARKVKKNRKKKKIYTTSTFGL